MTSPPALRPAPADAAPEARELPARLAAPGERVALLVLLVVLIAARVLYIHRLPFDSDEAQHLHVAWEWTQGRVQYRDTFDNHAPLFHLLAAPVLAWVGERADVQILARYAVLPLFAAMLVATGLLGRRLFGARAGAWAAVLLGFHLEFFTTSMQFRTDDLWVAVWLLSVLVLVGGRWSLRRAFLGGLLVGVAFSISLKTSLLVASLAAASLAAARFDPRPRRPGALGRAAAGAAAVTAGAAVVPAAVVAAFAALGAIDPLVACTIRHSAFSLGDGGWRPWAPWLLGGALLLVLGAGVAFARSPTAPGDRRRQMTVLWASGFAVAALLTIWPTSTPQDGMALLPAAFLALAALATRVADLLAAALARRGRAAARAVPAAVLVALAVVCVGRLLAAHPLSHDGTSASVRDLAQLLRLSDRDDYVMDAKGEAIFRRRPFYYVLELFTKHRMRAGLIEDRIVERCVETSTGFLFGSIGHIPPRPRRFFEEHYLGGGRLRVAGAVLRGAEGGGPVEFAVAIPGRYAFVERDGPARGTVDGTPYAGPRWLAAGPHAFTPAEAGRATAFVWAKAAERGFLPFAAPEPPR